MTLRTPNPFPNRQTLLDLNRIKERLAVYGEQIASGKRITRLSDDPTGAALILDFNASIARNDQYSKMISSAGIFLKTTEDALSQVNNEITRLLELGQQGLSDTTGASGRANIASEVDGIRTNLLAIGNMQAQGKYVFSGTRTTTQPFSGPSAGPITYAGDGNTIDLDVSLGTTVSTNFPGDEVFFGGPAVTAQGTSTDLFQQVTDLRDGLLNNNTAQIQTAYNNLQTILQRINAQTTQVGGRQASLDQLSDAVSSFTLSLQSIKGTYEDLDYPDAITKYSTDQTTQSAAMSVLAKANNQNLFNFLA
jgi:flagellar hook-associated protein 3 FlgL